METKPPIFRQSALNSLKTPEDLSKAIEVVTVKGWIALAVLGILIAFALIWGTFGTLSSYVTGKGILLEGHGIDVVMAPAPGRLTTLSVKIGDVVTPGQIVGKIHTLDTEDRVAVIHSDADRAQKEWQLFSDYDAKTFLAQKQTLRQKQQDTRIAITQLNTQIKAEEARLSLRENLLKDGLVDPDNVMSVKDRLIEKEQELKAQESQLLQLQAQAHDLEQQYFRQKSKYKFDVDHSKMLLDQGAERLNSDENLRSEVMGIVTEIRVNKGDILNVGDIILTVELASTQNALQATLFMPASLGKRIQPGMTIKVSPSTAKKELYGRMIGTVTFVSPYPESFLSMKALLRNDPLIHSLTQDEPVLRVEAKMKQDPNTPSGFKWTSGKGPRYPIQGGTLCEGNVVIDQQSPLVRLFPFLYRFLRR